MNDFLPVRKNPRLSNYDYSSSGSYFITICTKDRYHLLGNIIDTQKTPAYVKPSGTGMMVERSIHQIPVLNPGVEINAYCIMPDHVHMIVTLTGSHGKRSIPHIIGRFKSYTDHLFRTESGFSLWQRDYYDHIIRNQEDFNLIVEYINQNPTAWAEKHRELPY